jgi:hypothetical protein
VLWLRQRRWRRGRTALHQIDDLVAHLGLDGAELALHVNAVLLAQDNEVLALHVQLAGKREDANFVFLLLQAETPRDRLLSSYVLPGNGLLGV